ncbi:MAG TPA: hypothetical protein DC038_01905 [Clostridiales bacterium]|nr:hypothetical protein [Clostridiales bacterium]
MKFTGMVEKKRGSVAVILVKKVLPCGDSCRSCSVGCKFYSMHIQTEVADDINEGDYVSVEQKSEVADNSGITRYVISAAMIALSVLLVQLIPQVRNSSSILASAMLISAIASHYVQKYCDKISMKKNAENFIVGKKLN